MEISNQSIDCFKFISWKNKYIGIDLGSANLAIYEPSKGVIYNEPNIIAVDIKEKKVVSIGYLALKMEGKEQENIQVVRPVENGTISSISRTNCSVFNRSNNLNVFLFFTFHF